MIVVIPRLHQFDRPTDPFCNPAIYRALQPLAVGFSRCCSALLFSLVAVASTL
eukprot:SAG22_NODE_5392_length_1022_cov_0.720779_3_plen_52_part_01